MYSLILSGVKSTTTPAAFKFEFELYISAIYNPWPVHCSEVTVAVVTSPWAA